MRFSAAEIQPLTRHDGFDQRVIEKVLHLVHLLNTLNSHPSLRGKWVLKGGTALNLFVLPPSEIVGRHRSQLHRCAGAREHAGGKWRLSYPSFTGHPANLDVDFNFMYRQPLWEINHADSHPLGNFQAKRIPILDLHELAAGKLSRHYFRAGKPEICSIAIAFSIRTHSSAKGSASLSSPTGV